MTRVIISPRADADVDDIIRYLFRRGGIEVVRTYLDAFDRIYDKLAAFPGAGAPRPKLGALARIDGVWPFLIVYDWDKAADTVVILRIVRGSRRVTRELARKK